MSIKLFWIYRCKLKFDGRISNLLYSKLRVYVIELIFIGGVILEPLKNRIIVDMCIHKPHAHAHTNAI